jgi:GMP synthase-like glutamine amidotransferase
VEEITSLDAVLVTGSEDSVLNKSEGIQKTIDNLGSALKLAPGLKVAGICFGHQLILQYFGAEVVTKSVVGGL